MLDVPGVSIDTARLRLRLPCAADFERFAEMSAHGEAARYIGGPVVREAAWRRFLQQPGAWMLQGFGMFAVVERASGRWVGQMGPWRPEGWPGNEIGYAFHPDAWGQGYAIEAATAAIDWAFEALGWDDIIHCIDPGNLGSQRVAQRLGSTRHGPCRLPPPFEEALVDIWGQTRAQWRARAASTP